MCIFFKQYNFNKGNKTDLFKCFSRVLFYETGLYYLKNKNMSYTRNCLIELLLFVKIFQNIEIFSYVSLYMENQFQFNCFLLRSFLFSF